MKVVRIGILPCESVNGSHLHIFATSRTFSTTGEQFLDLLTLGQRKKIMRSRCNERSLSPTLTGSGRRFRSCPEQAGIGASDIRFPSRRLGLRSSFRRATDLTCFTPALR